MMNAEYEYIALHRDVGETELKQGREIGEGGNLVYVDSAAVWAVKAGRLLILEGIEKAERGIMPARVASFVMCRLAHWMIGPE
jgi:von Willebrand factor A domain-containing protein 8